MTASPLTRSPLDQGILTQKNSVWHYLSAAQLRYVFAAEQIVQRSCRQPNEEHLLGEQAEQLPVCNNNADTDFPSESDPAKLENAAWGPGSEQRAQSASSLSAEEEMTTTW